MASINAIAPVWIVTIDGKKVSRAGITGHKQFRVSPGLHVVEVEYSQIGQPFLQESRNGNFYTTRDQAFSEKNVPLRFLATAGTTYYVRAGRAGDSWRPTITDIPEPAH